MNQQPSLYEIYVTAYGKVRTGKVLDDADFGYSHRVGKLVSTLVPFDVTGKLAVTTAADDVKTNKPMRTQAELEAFIAQMLGRDAK